MHSISSKYRKPKGRLNKRRAACIRNLEKGKSSAYNVSSDNKCDEISTEAVPSTSGTPCMDRKTFSKCLENLCNKNENAKVEMLRISREHVRQTNLYSHPDLGQNNIIDITVSYDGTWHKRGHTSLYGIGIVIDIMTSLVVDFEVLSKYCHECSMAAKDMGEASPRVSDLEIGAFRKMPEKNLMVPQKECVNHVAKRLGTALRNKVKEWRSKGVTLGGRKQGSLTDATITKLQNFHRKAIVDNVPEVEKMKASIFATLFHCMLTDAKPMHSKCPHGKLSWCFYNRAKADNKVPGSHKSMKTKLSEEVVAKIMPVYQRLASNEILLRCVSGKTQNANESLHSCIWRKCPKDVFVSKKRIDLAVTVAVSEVNIGYVETLKLKNTEMVDAAFF
ncbi:uncharacterized protein TNCV_1547681 [Trichonephila clavipes]|nr:uncharacterized protein TNCV_1547681 [Trichonephila clavipes]